MWLRGVALLVVRFWTEAPRWPKQSGGCLSERVLGEGLADHQGQRRSWPGVDSKYSASSAVRALAVLKGCSL